MPYIYQIKKSKRAKNLIITINTSKEICVTIPHYTSESIAHKFVEEKKEWISKQLAKIETKPLMQYKFESGESIPYLGGALKINIIETNRKYPKAEVISESINIYIPKDKSDKNTIKQTIIKHLKENFREIIYESIEEFNRYYGFKFNRIAIKDNKTNWGSCSSKRNLNFNWRLIFAPIEIIDYVVIHELCHLKEQNHGKDFWNLVSHRSPNFKKHKKWLRDNSYKLSLT